MGLKKVSMREESICSDVLKRMNIDGVEIYTADQFLTDEECRVLRDYIDANAVSSTVWLETSRDRVNSLTRTSSTADVGSDKFSTIKAIDRRMAEALDVPVGFGEVTQGQKYESGQEFTEHTDYFKRKWYQRFSKGQRIWTFMIYLNGDCHGGETEFIHASLLLRPETGKAVVWRNIRRNGRPNPDTLHAGRPVTSGSKYIITKWFRDSAINSRNT